MSMERSETGRAAAILTTGEVDGSTFDLTKVARSSMALKFDFTLGSLTNCTLRFYGTVNGTTWYPMQDIGGNVSYTLTANTTRIFAFVAPGVKQFKASVQGSGTTTSSSAAFDYLYEVLGAW